MQKSILTDEFIDEFSERLTQDWHKLGIELCVDHLILERLYDQKIVHAENWPFRMLQEWKRREENNPNRIKELLQALKKIHRADLIEFTRRRTGDGQHDIDEKILAGLGEQVQNEWIALGINLGVPINRLDSIKLQEVPSPLHRPESEMLKAFREGYNGSDIIEDLRTGLRHIRRQDLAHYVGSKFPDQRPPLHVPQVTQHSQGPKRQPLPVSQLPAVGHSSHSTQSRPSAATSDNEKTTKSRPSDAPSDNVFQEIGPEHQPVRVSPSRRSRHKSESDKLCQRNAPSGNVLHAKQTLPSESSDESSYPGNMISSTNPSLSSTSGFLTSASESVPSASSHMSASSQIVTSISSFNTYRDQQSSSK